MNLSEYVKFVGTKIEQAEAKPDREEVIRLSRLLIETLLETVTKLEAGA